MDNLIGHFVAGQTRDFSRTPPGRFQHVGRRVVHRSKAELDAVGIEQADAIAAAKVSANSRTPEAAGTSPVAERVATPLSTAIEPTGRSANAIQCFLLFEPHSGRRDQRARLCAPDPARR